jgi:hypothetical protein
MLFANAENYDNYDVLNFPNPIGGLSILQREFLLPWCLCEGIPVHLMVICIGVTFLTGKYKSQILTAIGMDGNYEMFPLAFTFVDNENTNNWYLA